MAHLNSFFFNKFVWGDFYGVLCILSLNSLYCKFTLVEMDKEN